MTAIHGGQAKTDPIDAHTIAVLRRGGLRPQASVDPAARRATRDLRRRRMYLMRPRAELLTHAQHTSSQDHLPEIGKNIAYKANRDGMAQRCPDPAVQKRIAVDRTLIGHYDQWRNDLERSLLPAATPHGANILSLLRTVPGIGKIRSRVLLYELHDISRFPSVQDFVSSGRLGKCAKASARSTGVLHPWSPRLDGTRASAPVHLAVVADG